VLEVDEHQARAQEIAAVHGRAMLSTGHGGRKQVSLSRRTLAWCSKSSISLKEQGSWPKRQYAESG
jgi:hypothetical protein